MSIVTPSFNQAEFLKEAIRSVLNQDYPRIEYLVLDGGSTDGSLEVISQYGRSRSITGTRGRTSDRLMR